MGNSRRGFLAMVGVIPGWFLGKVFCKSQSSSSSISSGDIYGSSPSTPHPDYSCSDVLSLSKCLSGYGYDSEDAKSIAFEYKQRGLGAAINVVEDWEEDGENMYTVELCEVIHQWRFGHQLNYGIARHPIGDGNAAA